VSGASNGKAGDPAPVKPVAVVITFDGIGAAGMSIKAEGVNLAQLMGAAFYLDCLAREARAGALTQEAMRQLDVPFADVLAGLRREGRL
jgi:hypothetical protein